MDDDPAVRESLRRVLERAGYEVETATGAGQAILRLNLVRIDVVVLDFEHHSRMMRRLIARLAAGDQRCRLLLLVRSLEQLILASEAKADMVLLKPLEPNRLSVVLNNLLSRRDKGTLDCEGSSGRTEPFSPLPVCHGNGRTGR